MPMNAEILRLVLVQGYTRDTARRVMRDREALARAGSSKILRSSNWLK